MNNLELAIALVKAENEETVIQILKDNNYWDNYNLWRPYGDFSNNIGIIGAQQDSPDTAFVEKIINSIDATLTCECLKRGINPTSPEAPQSMDEALEKFYGIRGGLAALDSSKRSELAQYITIAATEDKRGGQINLCIADKGEGQTPNRMPDTLLSLNKSNKINIHFVQGKFNMGGAGALAFCGKNHLQLIISRRCPDIPNSTADETFTQWSVTIVRREDPREGCRGSMYTYLTDADGKILSFDADSLCIIPKAHVTGVKGFEYEQMFYGTFIKLYNYKLDGYRTAITRDLYDRLALLLPGMALPVQLRDTREFNAHSNYANLSGLLSRLGDDKNNVIEDNFPTTGSFNVDGQVLKYSIYLFKPETEKKYRGKNAGILFTTNGQTQGIFLDSFFNSLNLSYIKNSILMIVDCSGFDAKHHEDFFMTSRDRIRNNSLTKEMRKSIEQILRDHQGLKAAAHARRAAALQNRLADDQPLKNVLQNIVNRYTILNRLFTTGQAITTPFSTTGTAGTQEHYEGKLHPTFFTLKGKFKEGKLTKHVPCNSSFRVQFVTDIQNDYFNRQVEAGELLLKMDGESRNDLIQHLGTYNGIVTLTVSLPENAAAGDKHTYETEIRDECIVETFPSIFYAEIEAAADAQAGGSGQRHLPVDPHTRGNQHNPEGFALPEVFPVNRDEWEDHNMDQFSALAYRTSDEGYDFFLNMDNNYLLYELRGLRDQNLIELTRARYKYSMALIGMSIISYYKNNETANADIDEDVRRLTTMISPILIPMLETMANLDLSEPGQVA